MKYWLLLFVILVLIILITNTTTTTTTTATATDELTSPRQITAPFPCSSGNVRLERCPSGVRCQDLGVECLAWCHCPADCRYGRMTNATCNVHEDVHCDGPKTFQKEFRCQYCFQETHKYRCEPKFDCNSVSYPNKRLYIANCTVSDEIICLGRRQFLKQQGCNWTAGYRWSTALALSITLGGFGADRFYLGHWQEGIGKLFSFGGLGVWTLVDVVMVAIRYIGPADGSLYI